MLFVARSSSPRLPRLVVSALALLLAGVVASFLDASRRWCDPGDHLVQGHALWQVLSALSLLAAYFHYRRIGPALARA